MEAIMKKLFISSSLMAILATTACADQPSPTVQYTPEQVAACSPTLRTDSDSDAEKSHTGEPVTATATSSITAVDGRFLDFREGTYAYTTSGIHLRRKGPPQVSERINETYPKTVVIVTDSHRGRSLRFGRNAEAGNHLSIYEVNGTTECLAALGYLSF